MAAYHDTRTDTSPFYVRVDGRRALSSDEPCNEAMARWESARDQGVAYAAIAALNTAVWLCQDVLTNEEVTAAVCTAMAAATPRPIFEVEPRLPEWALGLLEHDDRYQQLEPGIVHVPPAAQRELVAHLRQRLVKAAWRLEGDTESLTEGELTSIAESIEDARDWIGSLTSATGATVQPGTTYLRDLVTEAHAAAENDAARMALAGVLEQFTADVQTAEASEPAAAVEVEIPENLLALIREGLAGVVGGAANTIDVSRLHEDDDWRPGHSEMTSIQLGTELIDRIDAHQGDGPAKLTVTVDHAAQLVAAIDYYVGGLEDDIHNAAGDRDGALVVQLARTLEQLRMLRETISKGT